MIDKSKLTKGAGAGRPANAPNLKPTKAQKVQQFQDEFTESANRAIKFITDTVAGKKSTVEDPNFRERFDAAKFVINKLKDVDPAFFEKAEPEVVEPVVETVIEDDDARIIEIDGMPAFLQKTH